MSRASWIEMTTTSIAGTGGDGAVTMTALTSIPTFTSVFGSGTRMVEYTIEDTTAGAYKFEEGMGSVASNVLTRSKVRATWTGSVYDGTVPTALAFGSSPSSGVIRIRLAPHAHEFIHAPPGIVSGISGDTLDGYQASGHLSTFGNPGNSGGTLATATEYYFPFLCLIRGQCDGFFIYIDTAGAGGTGIKAALYDVGIDGAPGPCITRFNALSCASTGAKTDTVPSTWGINTGPLRFGVGWFYVGLMTDGTPTLTGWPYSSNGQLIAYPPVGKQGGYGWGQVLRKAAENSYATGMPSGTPAGTYTMPLWGHPIIALKITN